ncbi:HAD-IA family hydrolase [Ramlibacter sp. USB13]|uniref:HAD-IA family hydrolase n=1 Tax=Ramlibacter cellulosilyticus TaxID=2764187 RepID=A0A923MPV8_9BURK|nr:HAD-IA family hydrolase [Ramlibacter cellulosilyticus]MBC5783038.1 HAD-IA family hydrolase [Ramlibacter cellulosilyticus]
MLALGKIKAITLDLDDTLWPIWPTIERAEKVLLEWLSAHAPMTSALFANPAALRDIRAEMTSSRPDLKHDMSALRLESIRLALTRAGDDPQLAEPAFEAFFAERQRVTLFDDVLPALEFLAERFPLVALSNGNADVQRVGLGRFFRASVCARDFGVGKPDPRIFHAAAGAVDTMPEFILHVGDDVTLDALGALNAGMQAAWVNRSDAIWPHEQEPHVTLTHLGELKDLFAGE